MRSHLRRPAGTQALKDRTVLAVDRNDLARRSAAARRITSGPATTSVSLLARATRLPAATAAQVLRNPALPTMAVTTKSTSGRADGLFELSRSDEHFHARRPTTSANRQPDRGRWPRSNAAKVRRGLLLEQLETGMCRQADGRQSPLAGSNHFERAAANAAGGTEHGDVGDRWCHRGRK